eukprot:4866587-Alexandrium_andersonii.AAC.1
MLPCTRAQWNVSPLNGFDYDCALQGIGARTCRSMSRSTTKVLGGTHAEYRSNRVANRTDRTE